MAPDLSICIVDHHTPQLVQACLRSIFEPVQDPDIEGMVVNNSPDAESRASLRQIAEQFPSVEVIQNDVNFPNAVTHLLEASRVPLYLEA